MIAWRVSFRGSRRYPTPCDKMVGVPQKLVAEKEQETAVRLKQEEQIVVLKKTLHTTLAESEARARQVEEAMVKVKAAQHAREVLVQEVCSPPSRAPRSTNLGQVLRL